MKAMILAAGLGTRLQPRTDHIPKALVEVSGKPMLAWVMEKLIQSGIQEVVINIHHFPDQIKDFLKGNNNFGIQVHLSDESAELLDSGGGILNAKQFLEHDVFVVYNVDILCNIDLKNLEQAHRLSHAMATLAVRNRNTSRYLLFDDDFRLRAWENQLTGQYKGQEPNAASELKPLAFSGISIFSPEIFGCIKETGKFSLTDLLLKLAPEHQIRAYPHDEDYWFDLGSEKNI